MLLALCGNLRKIRLHHSKSLFSLPLLISYRYKDEPYTQTSQQEIQQDQNGTEYSNWILARSAKFNHDISFLKRRYGRDRYNIHKLTNMEFMCSLVNRQQKYTLNLNQKIVLLAQMNHVCNVLKKDKGIYGQFSTLISQITIGLQNPEDYICVGTFMNALVDLGNYQELLWIYIMDALFVKKYDQQYDQLFGLYSGLYKYKKNVQEFNDYFDIQKDKVLYNIPIIYRNSLEVVRQYVKYNIYNLKQCRILFKSLHNCKINQKYFWASVSTWFNIYIKENLQKKDFQQFFIVPESSIQKVLFDDGMIRPRSILQQITQIAYILSQYGIISQRFITFIQNLIIYSAQHGSQLFIKFLQIEKQQKDTKQNKSINEHIITIRSHQQQALETMEKKYSTIFINPTDIGSETIINILIVLKRFFDTKDPQAKTGESSQTYDKKRIKTVDNRVLNWLVVRLCQIKLKYTVNQLLKVIECKDFLSCFRLDIKNFVLQKLKDVRSKSCSLQDLKDILYYLPLIQFQSISYIMEDFLFRAHPKEILQLTQLIQRQSMSPQDYQQYGENSVNSNIKQGQQKQSQIQQSYIRPKEKIKRWMPYLTKYFLKLPGAVNNHQRYYSFDQNCYFLYLLLKNQEYWQKQIRFEFLGQMQKLKHSIKIASYSRGFKLQMGTYFYKLMNYIDLVAFFDGG